jgi:hypothetical protein
VEFDGSGSFYLARSDADPMTITNATFAGWIYLDSTNSTQCIFAKDAGTSGNREYSLLWSQTGNELRWYGATNASTTAAAMAGVPVTPQTWTFFVVQADADNSTLRIRTGSGSTLTDWVERGPINPGWKINTSQSFRVGRRNDNLYPMDGRVDALGFWDRILTEDEIQALWNSGSGAFYPFE